MTEAWENEGGNIVRLVDIDPMVLDELRAKAAAYDRLVAEQSTREEIAYNQGYSGGWDTGYDVGWDDGRNAGSDS